MLLRFSPKVDHLKCVTLTPKEGLELSRTMVNLLPGVNEVTNDEWKAMRGNIIEELKTGEISILAQKVSAGRGKTGGIKAKDLVQMPNNIAVRYVSECNNPETLKKWYEEVINPEVRLAITKRLQKLEIELPEDKIPETPNGSPMSLAEFDEDESGEDSDEDEDFDDSDDEDSDETENDSDEEIDYSKLTVAELRKKCEERGINTKELSKKADFIEALENNSEE